MSVSARRVWILLAALASVSLTTSLGFWQLRRADGKIALARLIEQRQHDRPLLNADWPCATSHATLPEHRPALLTGRWLGSRMVYLDNRMMDGQAGFYVVTPLQLDPVPVCGPAVVLVQRGWVPRDASDRQRLFPVHTASGRVQVKGVIEQNLSQAYALGQEPDVGPQQSGPLLRQNMPHQVWSQWLGVAVAPGAVLQQDDPGSPSEDLKRHWPAPDTGVNMHRAYALQWFAMALIITGLYVWFQLLRPHRAD